MRECRTTRDEDSAHEWMLMVVAVESSWMIDVAVLLRFLNVEFILVDDCPAGFGDDPKWCDAVALREVVSLRHVFVAKINFDIWIILSTFLDLVVQTAKVRWVLWPETVEWPAVNVG